MIEKRNQYGFPDLVEGIAKLNEQMSVINLEYDEAVKPMLARKNRAQHLAAEARARILAAPCQCADCIKAQNLPAVQRILAHWTPMDKGI